MTLRTRMFRALGALIVTASAAMAQSPSTGRADPGPLVLDPATGLSVASGSTIELLFSTAGVINEPADIDVAANGDLLITNTAGQYCGSGALTTHVYRVPMNGSTPVQPVTIAPFTNTPVEGHLIEKLPNGELLVGGTCSLTQYLYRVDAAGNVTTFNPNSPINDPDGYTIGNLNGVPTLFVAAQDELVTFDLTNLANPVGVTLPVDLSNVGVPTLGNWGRVVYDPNEESLITTYVGHPTVERTVEIDLLAQASSRPARIEGPDSLEPLAFLACGSRIWGSADAVGFVDKSQATPTFVPLITGFTGPIRAVSNPNDGLYIIDDGTTMVYRWDPTLTIDTLEYDVNVGGLITMNLQAPAGRANERYLVLCSPIGATPGTPFGSAIVPLNYDIFTELLLWGVVYGNPYQLDWFGFLDGNGQATAQLYMPASLNVIPNITLHFAYIMANPEATSSAVWFHTR